MLMRRKYYLHIIKRLNTVMSDLSSLKDLIFNGKNISGPWRLSVWEKDGHPPSYVFSEEHANKGSCPDQMDISALSTNILNSTSNVHVFIEHYIHANEMINTKHTEEKTCNIAKDKAILNNMRNCLEVLRITDPSKKERIHFIDPRVDIVAILPDGKIYDALDMFITSKIKEGDTECALMTIYEAFIHPLMSMFPDKMVMKGRMVGTIENMRSKMTPGQKTFFDSVWKKDVIGRISTLTKFFRDMQKSSDLSEINQMYKLYKDMTNKFLDTWLLANVLIAENSMNMSASVIYLGSLHSLNFEEYLHQMGYTRKSLFENKNLSACLKLN